ncbi:MAG: GDP-mannose 4,6-dehydratase [Ignavibacteriae bacterium]|nr:GDP-mannose 4,6-dehydratase [Ignavibacteriota bacterium]
MIGTHLAELYLKKGCEVAGISRATSSSRLSNGALPWKHYAGDILDENFLARVWSDYKPELIFHLAAQAYNGLSWEAEDSTYALNIAGARNVFKVTRKTAPDALLIPACSSAEYGIVAPESLPIDEDNTPLHPITPYGVSKACMEMMGHQFCLNYKMRFMFPRLFIHVGPNHPPATALQAFAMQLAAIKLGKLPPIIKVGNLETSRDFVDVRDGVRALDILASKGEVGHIYNICSGTSWTIKESLASLIELSEVKVEVVQDPALFRPSDEQLLLGSPKKMRELGWNPTIPFHQTLKDIFENWLSRLRN